MNGSTAKTIWNTTNHEVGCKKIPMLIKESKNYFSTFIELHLYLISKMSYISIIVIPSMILLNL